VRQGCQRRLAQMAREHPEIWLSKRMRQFSMASERMHQLILHNLLDARPSGWPTGGWRAITSTIAPISTTSPAQSGKPGVFGPRTTDLRADRPGKIDGWRDHPDACSIPVLRPIESPHPGHPREQNRESRHLLRKSINDPGKISPVTNACRRTAAAWHDSYDFTNLLTGCLFTDLLSAKWTVSIDHRRLQPTLTICSECKLVMRTTLSSELHADQLSHRISESDRYTRDFT
jgi:hypothetical protein